MGRWGKEGGRERERARVNKGTGGWMDGVAGWKCKVVSNATITGL